MRQLQPSCLQSLPVLVIMSSLVIPGCGSGEKPGTAIIERFDANSFDRNQWRIAQPGKSIGTVEIQDEALLITVPPAKEARPQITSKCKSEIDGDFEVQMEFKLLDPLPDPTKEYINIELILFGPEGTAHFSRTNHHGAGNGFVCYFAPKVESMKSHWKFTPTDASQGVIKVRRKANKLEYLFEEGGGTQPIGESDFGNAMLNSVGVAITVASPTEKPFRVRIDNIEIRSTPPQASKAQASLGRWVALGGAGVLLIGGFSFFLILKSSQRPSASPPSRKHAPPVQPRLKKSGPASTLSPESIRTQQPEALAQKLITPDTLDDFTVV